MFRFKVFLTCKVVSLGDNASMSETIEITANILLLIENFGFFQSKEGVVSDKNAICEIIHCPVKK